MLQNRQIVLSTFEGYLDYLAGAQPSLSPDAACQIAAVLTQAEFNLQLAESNRKP
jgi:hypothetical protein